MAATVVNQTIFGAPGVSDPVMFNPGLVGITRKIDFSATNVTASTYHAFIAVPKGFVITGAFVQENKKCAAGNLSFKIADAADSTNDKAVGSAVTVGGTTLARSAQNATSPIVLNDGAIVSLTTSVAQSKGEVEVAIYGYTPWGDSLDNVITPDYRTGQSADDEAKNRAGKDPFLDAQAAKMNLQA